MFNDLLSFVSRTCRKQLLGGTSVIRVSVRIRCQRVIGWGQAAPRVRNAWVRNSLGKKCLVQFTIGIMGNLDTNSVMVIKTQINLPNSCVFVFPFDEQVNLPRLVYNEQVV